MPKGGYGTNDLVYSRQYVRGLFGPILILLKSNKFNMVAVSVKRSI